MNDKIEKKPDSASAANNSLTTNRKMGGITGLHARASNQPKPPGAHEMRYRLGVMLDCSGSMAFEKMDKLKEAMQGLCSACNFMQDTSMAVRTFPEHGSVPLTCIEPALLGFTSGLNAAGGTPMSAAMEAMLASEPITRGIILSDGQPDWANACVENAKRYAQAEIPVDTVHIGGESAGEELLKQIAEITGGKYIKFTEVSSFGANFKYLAPAFRGMLESGNSEEIAKMLGAKEVK